MVSPTDGIVGVLKVTAAIRDMEFAGVIKMLAWEIRLVEFQGRESDQKEMPAAAPKSPELDPYQPP